LREIGHLRSLQPPARAASIAADSTASPPGCKLRRLWIRCTSAVDLDPDQWRPSSGQLLWLHGDTDICSTIIRATLRHSTLRAIGVVCDLVRLEALPRALRAPR